MIGQSERLETSLLRRPGRHGRRHDARKTACCMAVRAPDGQILTYEEETPRSLTLKWMSIPFLRGVLGLWDFFEPGHALPHKVVQHGQR